MDGEGDLESGWEKVKPRKSFGTEGAERFNGRMGGVDRHRDDRRFKDREEGDARPQRGFGTFPRDKDGDHEQERDLRRNGLGRGRTESWRDKEDAPPTPRDRNSNGDRLVDRSRGWREKERDDKGDQERDNRGDRGAGRNDRGDRRWDRNRDDRQEREPEWMDEPADHKGEAHTQEDFQKWKDSMNKSSAKTPADEMPPKSDAVGSFFNLEQPKVETPLAIETGPDKFFGMWATPTEELAPASTLESKKEGVARPKTGGKASRFTSFFTPQEEPPRRDTEPVPAVPPPSADIFASLFQAQGNGQGNGQTPDVEKAAFQQLLRKLKGQAGGPSKTPPVNPQQQPLPPASAPLPSVSAPPRQHVQPPPVSESFQQYRQDRQDHQERQEERPSGSARNSQHALQDLLSQRQGTGSQPPVRPEQMLNDLVGQRHNASSQGSFRPDQAQSRNNSQFLMDLMRNTPEPQRIEQTLLRMPPQRPVERGMPLDRQLREQMILEREAEMQREAVRERERNASQRQGRPQAPPGFYDEPRGIASQHERHGNAPQPTQILQRPPPGLNNMQPSWAQSPSDLGPQQLRQQHIAPPPGLASGPSRGMPIPQMFPPGFQSMGNFPPPDARMQPPPGFFNPPPPGFMPPGMNGFPGPEGFGGQHFDGRGPPPSAYRRQ